MDNSKEEDQPLNFSKSSSAHKVLKASDQKHFSRKKAEPELVPRTALSGTSPSIFIPSGLVHPNYMTASLAAVAAVSAAINAAACRQIPHPISPATNSEQNLTSASLGTSSSLPPQCSSNTPTLLCAVCGDVSSGKHYGILACNGCSGFFKRSVRRRLIYRCQAGTGSCVVDKTHRNQCQACRLRKCLSKGMNRDAVQNERQPRSTATVRNRSESSPPTAASAPASFSQNTLAESGPMTVKGESQQILCVEEGWCDLFLLSVFQWSTQSEKCLLFASDSLPSAEHLSRLEDVFFRIRNQGVSKNEFACLKALVLFQPGIRELKRPTQVEELQDHAQQMLFKHASQFGSTRFGRLLLLLPQLRTIGRDKIEEAYFRPIFGNTSVMKVISAMYRGKLKE